MCSLSAGGPDLTAVSVLTRVPPRGRDGVLVATGSQRAGVAGWPYSVGEVVGTVPDAGTGHAAGELELIPYHSWEQDGLCTMRVWLPVG